MLVAGAPANASRSRPAYFRRQAAVDTWPPFLCCKIRGWTSRGVSTLHDTPCAFRYPFLEVRTYGLVRRGAAEGRRILRISDMASLTLGECRRRTHTCTWHAQKNKMGGRAPRRVWRRRLRSRCPGYSDGRPFGNLTARRKRGGPSVDWPSEGYLGRNTRSRFSPLVAGISRVR